MELSTLMPQELQHYKEAGTDRELFLKLVKKPIDLVKFFIACVEDETWSEAHPGLLQALLMWLTKRTYRDTLTATAIRSVAESMHSHYAMLSDWIPSDLEIEIADSHLHVNSLLLAASSESLRQRMRDECHERGVKFLALKEWNQEHFSRLKEHILRGRVEDLWRYDEGKVTQLMELAALYGLSDLRRECADVLKRYLTPEKALPLILYSVQKGLPELRAFCEELVNGEDWGFQFLDRRSPYLAVRLENLKDRTLSRLEPVMPLVTHVACSETVSNDPQFGGILNRFSFLNGLELSGTKEIAENLIEQIPIGIQRLEIASCGWMTDDTFQQLMERIDMIFELDLSSSPNLTYMGFFWLGRLYSLEELHLARCLQVSDEMLTLILQACRHITILNLERCERLSEKILHDTARNCLGLNELNLSHCPNVTDSVLLEAASRLAQLHRLEIRRCTRISDKGILEFVRQARQLNYLDVSQIPFGWETLQSLQAFRPGLKIVVED